MKISELKQIIKEELRKALREAQDDYARGGYDVPDSDEGTPTIGTFESDMDLGADFPEDHEDNRQDKGTGYAELGKDVWDTLSYKEKRELSDKYYSALRDDKWWVIGRAIYIDDKEFADKPFDNGKHLSPSARREWKRIKSEQIDEDKGSKPDFLDLDKDGNKKEPMKQAAKEAGKTKKLDEKELTGAEKKEKEKIVKGMKSSKKDFEKRYPGRGEEVMYATATKAAKERK